MSTPKEMEPAPSGAVCEADTAAAGLPCGEGHAWAAPTREAGRPRTRAAFGLGAALLAGMVVAAPAVAVVNVSPAAVAINAVPGGSNTTCCGQS